MNDIVLIGGGGHCRSVIDSILSQGKYRIAAIADNRENLGREIRGYTISHTDDDLADLFNSGVRNAFITVGSTGRFELRRKLYMKAKEIGFDFPVITDPSAVVSADSSIGEGVFIGKNCVVNTGAVIERLSIVNTGAIIEHDCRVGEFAFISIGAVVAGNVNIGYDTFIGAGAVIVQGITIAEHSLVGAGSVVVKNIPAKTRAFGVPCREISEW